MYLNVMSLHTVDLIADSLLGQENENAINMFSLTGSGTRTLEELFQLHVFRQELTLNPEHLIAEVIELCIIRDKVWFESTV